MATATTLTPLETSEADISSEANNRNSLPEESSIHRNTEMSSDSQPSPKLTDANVENLKDDELSDSPASASESASSASPSAVSPTGSDANKETASKETADAEEGGGEDEEPEELKIPFAPGDHITRWEMLPIAWPIQVHGIVLEVHEDAVVLVDFGLAAVPKGKNHKKNKKKEAVADKKKQEISSDQEASESNVEASENGEDGGEAKDGSEPPKADIKKQQQHVKNAVANFQKGFKREKNRLNVQTLTTQKEISKWSKVNYDGGLFGFGNKENGEEVKGNDNKNGEEAEDGKSSSENGTPRKEKRESWWGNWKKAQENRKAEREKRKQEKNNADDTGKSTNSTEDTVEMSTRSNSEGELESAATTDSSSTPTNVSGCGDTPWWCRVSIQRGKRRPSADGKVAAAMMDASKKGDLVQQYKDKGNNDDSGDFVLEIEKRLTRKSMKLEHDEYMANGGPGTASYAPAAPANDNDVKDADNGGECETSFEEEKKDDHETLHESESATKEGKAAHLSVITTEDPAEASPPTEATSSKSPEISPAASASPEVSPSSNAESESSEESSSSPKSESSTTSPKKRTKHQSKADPPAVVLARTRWLLKHGEGILPPYHAFSSNSECIAVFCKTGYWSTLQADIFLHSTAIGNAKSTVVMTLGMAASVPMLAPVVGAVGLGAVVAPWFYLDKQKKAARETQQRLADQFWAQVEPEVIVACVKEWSNLESLEEEVEEETTPEEVISAETLQKVEETVGEEGVTVD
mmetsp:Transcript_11961/g.28626  ORF Transcript_11961/g.28626 Transcript_11961/m.28626 type:complete len:753 (-) Transcript_11961:83-2341(-)